MAADFTMGIYVVAVEVATVGVGTAGRIGFMDKVGVGRQRLGNYPDPVPSLHQCSGLPFLVCLLGH